MTFCESFLSRKFLVIRYVHRSKRSSVAEKTVERDEKEIERGLKSRRGKGRNNNLASLALSQ